MRNTLKATTDAARTLHRDLAGVRDHPRLLVQGYQGIARLQHHPQAGLVHPRDLQAGVAER